jgi:hypothetical protein
MSFLFLHALCGLRNVPWHTQFRICSLCRQRNIQHVRLGGGGGRDKTREGKLPLSSFFRRSRFFLCVLLSNGTRCKAAFLVSTGREGYIVMSHPA